MSTSVRPWIANARMYSVSVAAAESWRQLLSHIARRARLPVQIIDHPRPAPLSELWARTDQAAVFMCGLPFSRAEPPRHLIAAPVPSPSEFHGQPRYWSEFVVHADSPYRALSDVFGRRIAFTSTESQSGFAAPLQHLRQAGEGCDEPLFREVIAPQITPQGALAAVAEGRADVAAIDAYSLLLLRRFAPELAANVRSVARTEPRPIPPLVASSPLQALSSAFEEAHEDATLHSLLTELRLSRFVRPDPASYQMLRREFDATLAHWHRQPLAQELDPAFHSALTGAGGA